MKNMKVLFVAAALTASSLAMASGGGDRTFARMESARKASMQAFQLAEKQKAEAAVAASKTKPVNDAKG